jgi:hypothetical protein
MRTALLSLLLALAFAAPAAADSIVYIKDANVWVAQPDGTQARALTTDGTAGLPYASPSQADDGTVLAVRGSRFHKLDRQGRLLATFNSLLTDKPGTIMAVGPFDTKLSPDGSKFAYWLGIMGSWYDYATDRWYTDPQSSVAYQSAADGTPLGSTMFFEEPSWKADGSVLLFDSINGGVPQVYTGAVGMNHNELTPWFHDRDVFGEDAWRPTGAGELTRDGRRLAALRAGGTMGEGYEARGRFNRIQLYTVTGLQPPAPECQIGDPDGAEFGPPSWSPAGDALAWATPNGIYTSKVCEAFAPALVVPGGREPDGVPAAPGQAAPVIQPPPGQVETPAAPAPPKLAGVKAKRGRITVAVTCTCKASATARKGKKVIARGKGTGKVVLKFSKRVRGKVKLTVKVGSTRLAKTVRIR